jgi:hypothetical protein
MAVIKRKPTSPGRRFVVSVVNPDLHKVERRPQGSRIQVPSSPKQHSVSRSFAKERCLVSSERPSEETPSEVSSPDPTAPNKSWSFSGTRTRAPQEADSLSQQPFKPPLLSVGAGSAFAKACYPASIVGFPLIGVLV